MSVSGKNSPSSFSFEITYLASFGAIKFWRPFSISSKEWFIKSSEIFPVILSLPFIKVTRSSGLSLTEYQAGILIPHTI